MRPREGALLKERRRSEEDDDKARREGNQGASTGQSRSADNRDKLGGGGGVRGDQGEDFFDGVLRTLSNSPQLRGPGCRKFTSATLHISPRAGIGFHGHVDIIMGNGTGPLWGGKKERSASARAVGAAHRPQRAVAAGGWARKWTVKALRASGRWNTFTLFAFSSEVKKKLGGARARGRYSFLMQLLPRGGALRAGSRGKLNATGHPFQGVRGRILSAFRSAQSSSTHFPPGEGAHRAETKGLR